MNIYSIPFRSNGPDTVYYMEFSQGEILQKPKMHDFFFLVHDTSSDCDVCTCEVS